MWFSSLIPILIILLLFSQYFHITNTFYSCHSYFVSVCVFTQSHCEKSGNSEKINLKSMRVEGNLFLFIVCVTHTRHSLYTHSCLPVKRRFVTRYICHLDYTLYKRQSERNEVCVRGWVGFWVCSCLNFVTYAKWLVWQYTLKMSTCKHMSFWHVCHLVELDGWLLSSFTSLLLLLCMCGCWLCYCCENVYLTISHPLTT